MKWSWEKVLLVSGIAVGGGVLAVITAGAAAPVVGSMFGGVLGFSGLAALKGGAVAAGCAGGACGGAAGAAGVGSTAAGGSGVAGGTTAVSGTAAGLGHAGTTFPASSLAADSINLNIPKTVASNLLKETMKTLNDPSEKGTGKRR